MTINCQQTIGKRDRFCSSVALNALARYVDLTVTVYLFLHVMLLPSKTSDVTQLHLVQQRCYFEAG